MPDCLRLLTKEKCDLNMRIETKRTELEHLKKELKTFERLNFLNVSTDPESKRVERKIQKLSNEIAKLKKS